MAEPTPEQARRIAAEGWIWGYPLVENYGTLYAQAVDEDDPRYVGGFGVFRHYPESFTPADTETVAPNNDTRYSWAWLDLRAEPWVVSVPDADRYYVLPFHDLDTSCLGSVGTRSTGQRAGDHLIAGPAWDQPAPDGITGVLRADGYLVGCLGRTRLEGPEDGAGMRALQEQYRLHPLSAYLGEPAPRPAPEPLWPVWRPGALESLEFFTLLDFLLGFFPVLPAESVLRNRLAGLGVDGHGEFEPSALSGPVREAMAEGIAEARGRLAEAARRAPDPRHWFGTRAQHGEDYLTRAVGVRKGLYGLPAEEAWYSGWTADALGNRPPDAAERDYLIRFPPGELPPAEFFWSATMYRLPERRLVDNPARRYAVGSGTPGLVADDDGGLTLYVRHEQPDDPRQRANWLPAPYGPFAIALRLYGPSREVLDGGWRLPELTPVGGDEGGSPADTAR